MRDLDALLGGEREILENIPAVGFPKTSVLFYHSLHGANYNCAGVDHQSNSRRSRCLHERGVASLEFAPGSVTHHARMEVRSVEAIVQALHGAKVQYLIVGGLAVNAHGFVRLTRDVDIVLALEPANAARGLEALLAIGYQMSIPARPSEFADAQIREEWRRDKQMIVLKLWSDEHRRTPVDIFVYEPFLFTAEWKLALKLEVFPGLSAPVVSLPTLLEMKRVAGRPQDLIDIAELQRMR